MAHESVLRLRAGPDLFLKSTSLALASIVIPVLFFCPSPWLIKIATLVICATIGYLIYDWDHEASAAMLNIFPDGRVHWESRSGQTGRAVLSTGHWLSLHYLVLTAADENAGHRFLVCRSLQPDQDFRMLRTWIRLGVPRAAMGPDGAV